MTTFLQCRDVSTHAGNTTLLSDVSLTVRRGDRIGLVGHNGCGKSTLLALLSGELSPSAGSVQRAQHCLCVHVEQYLPDSLTELTLWQALAAQLPTGERQSGAWRVDKTLADVGLAAEFHPLRAADLSGGQQNRLLLARALIKEPDLLLLDEPSNHLDLESYLWLEQLLQQSRQTFVLVSHDRRLLDAVTGHSWFLRDGTVQQFALPYTQARAALDEADQAAAARRADEEKEIARLTSSAKRLAMWGKNYDNEKFARKAQSMFKRIDKLEQEKTELSQGSPLNLSLGGRALSAKRWLTIEQADVQVAGRSLFTIDSAYVTPGERIALLGANGSGKSTFVHQLLAAWRSGEQDASVPLRLHPRSQIGLYDQEQAQLEPDWSLEQALSRLTEADARTRKMALISAGFPYLRHQDAVSQLSGGEKSRLLFTALALNSPDALILDEPTNHLDIEGKEQLERQLCDSQASVLLVSHDREFVERVCQRFWVIAGGVLHQFADAGQAYALISAHSAPAEPVVTVAGVASVSAQVPASGRKPDSGAVTESACEEQLLEQLVELEQLLADDLARKPKHQKPERQQVWREAIAELAAQLS